jgi:hypothetical protein
MYQRVYASVRAPEKLAAFLSTQLRVDRLFHRDGPWTLHRGDALPRSGSRHELFVVGDCTALYYSDGHEPSTMEPFAWIPVERTAAAGRFELSAEVLPSAAGVVEPLVSIRDRSGMAQVVGLEHLEGGEVRAVYRGFGGSSAGLSFSPPREPLQIVVDADRRLVSLSVREGFTIRLSTFFTASSDEYFLGISSGRPGVRPSYSGRLRSKDPGAPLCRRLVALESASRSH